MAACIIKKSNDIDYFVFSISDYQDVNDHTFPDIEKIGNSAFANATDVTSVVFGSKLKEIGADAFADCENLELFCCKNDLLNNDSDFVEFCSSSKVSTNTFTVKSRAFNSSMKLHTVILPDCNKLVIEKDAFKKCSSLRSFVCFCRDVIITEDPFKDCPQELTFICLKDSPLEKFAREHGYRFINA